MCPRVHQWAGQRVPLCSESRLREKGGAFSRPGGSSLGLHQVGAEQLEAGRWGVQCHLLPGGTVSLPFAASVVKGFLLFRSELCKLCKLCRLSPREYFQSPALTQISFWWPE